MSNFEETYGGIKRNKFAPEEQRRFWREAVAYDQATGESTYQERLLTAYRLVRELAHIRGAIKPDESLIQGLSLIHDQKKESMWTAEVPGSKSNTRAKYALDLQEATMSILPPQKPHNMNGDYLPAKDPKIQNYLKTLDFLAQRLSLYATHKSSLGMKSFLDPNTIQAAFPSAPEIMAFEQTLIKEGIEALVTQGTLSAIDWFSSNYEFNLPETKRILKIALDSSQELMYIDKKAHQALLLLDIERIKAKAQEDGELRTALAAIKLKAEMLGLKQTNESGSTMGKYLQEMYEVAKTKKLKGPK